MPSFVLMNITSFVHNLFYYNQCKGKSNIMLVKCKGYRCTIDIGLRSIENRVVSYLYQ